jgi:hypothetical protein
MIGKKNGSAGDSGTMAKNQIETFSLEPAFQRASTGMNIQE